ncbi:nucleolar zinc-finger protein [Mortierella sp. AD094]|nr:nucleolar zinc-finger protein [Mortierella sp. AD094]
MAEETKNNNDLGLAVSVANAASFDKKDGTQDTPEDGPLFQDIDGDQQVTEIESLCMNCHENGMTRLLLTRVPHFREVVIMAFDCPHCGFRSNELQQANAIAMGGAIYTCKISTKADLNRQLVKTDTAVVKLPDIDFEIPAQRGHLTTIEGLLQTAVDDLESGQPVRKYMDEALYQQIDNIIKKLQEFIENKAPFTVILDDPAGNSYIESLDAPKLDDKLDLSVYMRTRAQERAMGLSVPEESEAEKTEEGAAPVPMSQDQQIEHAQKQLWEAGLTEADLEKEREAKRQAATEAGENPDKVEEEDELPEVLSFPANCSSCNAPSDTKMHILDIPHFKEVIIMSTTCDECGYKSNEVKAGGPVSEFGKRIILKIEDSEDMSRDILKSETCGLSIPEIDLELNSGTLGGRFTTVEGLLRQVHDELSSKVPAEAENQPERRQVFTKFLDKLEQVMSLEIKSTLILDDPLGNSYLQNLYAPEPDPSMTIEEYKRTAEQDEILGLSDMRLENYENDHHHVEDANTGAEEEEEEAEELTEEQKEADEISGGGVSGGF